MQKRIKIILTAVFSLFVMSCSAGMDQLIDEFNSNYVTVIPERELPNVNKDGYKQSMMLQDHYHVLIGERFEANAPLGGKSYKWTLVNESVEPVEETVIAETLNVRMVIAEENFNIAQKYTLKLKVVNQSNKVFLDYADFYVFKER